MVGRASPSFTRLAAAQPPPGRRPAARSAVGAAASASSATTLREMRAFPLTLWFLGAYLLFNDGVQTVIALSATYGTEELGLAQSVLMARSSWCSSSRSPARWPRPAGRAVRRQADRLGALVAWTGVLVAAYFLQAGRGGAVLRCSPPSSGSSRAAPRRCPGRCSASSSRRARRPSTSASTRSATAARAGSDRWLFGLTFQLTGSYRLAIISLVVFFVVGFVAAGGAADAAGDRRGRQHPAGAPVTAARARRPTASRSPLPGPASVPASGDRRRHPAPAHLRFFHGPMDCGKSTLALQVDHNQRRQGRHGLLRHPGRPLRGAADQLPGRPLPRGDRDRRRHRPAAAGPRPLGRRPPGRLPDRRRGAVPHRGAGRPAGRARRRVRTSTSTPSG